ncbi:MAG: tetratricopeptide repeat protein [Ginsengibacter sp.]
MMSVVFGQDQKVADSLAIIYQQKSLADSVKFKLLTNLSFNETRDLKKGLQYAEDLISLSDKTGNNKYLRSGYFLKGNKKRALGKLDEALEAYIKSAEIARKLNNLKGEGETYGAIADSYYDANDHPNSKLFYKKAIAILRQSNDSISLASVLSNAGNEFLKTKNYDSALLYFRESKLIFDNVNYTSGKAYSRGGIGMVYAEIGDNDLAEKNIDEAIRILTEAQDYYPICDYLISMSDVYLNKGDKQTALNYTLRSLHLAEQYGLKAQIAAANLKLSELYENAGNPSLALTYYKAHIAYRDSINNLNTVQRMADLRTNFEVSQKQVEVNLLNQQKRNQNNLLTSLGVILVLTIIILFILLKNNQNKQKAYRILNMQKQETDEQKAKAEHALNELQVTQKQLIQSAKMASLGELTAGIAHEIQNPLNFVNNFSEVTVELLGELIEGSVNKLTGSDKAKADEILNDIADNLKKISHHGKRAESIVKGMLQHSRISSNKKELTDINALSDEYLRLSYHGLRAKDNTFNATIETTFDDTVEKLWIVPQDIGRVLLNICNNAFYSVHKKTKLNIEGYEPTLWIMTKAIVKDGELKAVQIRIKDNGFGIPDKILAKIYQPFFTTKPTGQGTGLGLSLSYDIITNEHKGHLNVESKEGEYAEFIIELPNIK